MIELQRTAEKLKLARVLNVPASQLAFLDSLAPLDIRSLRDGISSSLFNQHQGIFQRIANANKLMPASITAKMSEKVFGPLLSARVAGLMNVEKAIDISEKLPISFQADLCLSLDPRSAKELVFKMPVNSVIATSNELLKRREFITMARFVDALSDSTVQAVTASIQDDEALVWISSYIESTPRLNQLTFKLAPARMIGMAKIAAQKPELREPWMFIMSQLEASTRQHIGSVLKGLDEPTRDTLKTAAAQAGVDVSDLL